MWLTLLLVSFGLFYIWARSRYNYWKNLKIPALEPQFLFGNVRKVYFLQEHFGTIIQDWYEKYKQYPYYGYFKGFQPTLMINDPELVKNIMIRDQQYFGISDTGFNPDNDPLLADNPFFQKDEKWRIGRTIIAPIFASSKLKQMFTLMGRSLDKLEEYTKRYSSKEDINLKKLCVKYTTSNVVSCSFNVDNDCFDNEKSEYMEMGSTIFSTSTLQSIKLMLMFVMPMLVDWLPLRLTSKKFDFWIRKKVKDMVAYKDEHRQDFEDYLQYLLNVSGKYGLSEERIVGNILSFYVEGFETSSNVMSFALYELACHPDIQETLYEQIIEVLERHDNKLTYQAVQDMDYLENVILETLRIRPAALVFQKLCTADYKMPILEGHTEAFTVPKGMAVSIPVISLHMDPRYYPEPEKFDPTRFEEEERKNRNRGTYLAFGEGPRICIGMKFGMMQTKAGIATLLKNYKIVLSPNCKPVEIDPKGFMYTPKNPLLVNFVPR